MVCNNLSSAVRKIYIVWSLSRVAVPILFMSKVDRSWVSSVTLLTTRSIYTILVCILSDCMFIFLMFISSTMASMSLAFNTHLPIQFRLLIQLQVQFQVQFHLIFQLLLRFPCWFQFHPHFYSTSKSNSTYFSHSSNSESKWKSKNRRKMRGSR